MVISSEKYPITVGVIVYVGCIIYVCGVHLPWPLGSQNNFVKFVFLLFLYVGF